MRDLEIVDSISLLVRGKATFGDAIAVEREYKAKRGGKDSTSDSRLSELRLSLKRSRRISAQRQSAVTEKTLGIGTAFGTRKFNVGADTTFAHTVLGPMDQWRGTIVACDDCVLLTLTGSRIHRLASKFDADFSPIFAVLRTIIDRTAQIVLGEDSVNSESGNINAKLKNGKGQFHRKQNKVEDVRDGRHGTSVGTATISRLEGQSSQSIELQGESLAKGSQKAKKDLTKKPSGGWCEAYRYHRPIINPSNVRLHVFLLTSTFLKCICWVELHTWVSVNEWDDRRQDGLSEKKLNH